MRTALMAVWCVAMLCGIVSAGDAEPKSEDVSATDQLRDHRIVASVLESHGPKTVAKWIRKQRRGKVTVEVNGSLRPSIGPPNPKYVTPVSVLYDLRMLDMSAEEFAREVAGVVPVDDTKIVITQDDVGPVGGESDEEPQAGDDGTSKQSCVSVVRERVPGATASNGCVVSTVEDVSAVDSSDQERPSQYTVEGWCLDGSGITRRYVVTMTCHRLPIFVHIDGEGSIQPMAEIVEVRDIVVRID
jgi:hypothetical protein